MRITCKNPDCPRKGKPFVPKRAGAQYCTGACRIAAYRLRHKPLPSMVGRQRATLLDCAQPGGEQ
jgi:hypothetical protein